MREIITLQVGQAGNQLGEAFWTTILREHSLSSADGVYEGDEADRQYKTKCLDVLFQPLSSGKYVPRAVCVDLEPATLDHLRNGPIRGLMRPDSMISGLSGAGNNFSKEAGLQMQGFYTEGAERIEEIMDRIRKEMEDCDCPTGVSMLHSLGGGTGSGLGTLLLSKVKEEYPDRINTTFSVLPSPKVSDTVVEPYNTTLALHQLVENSDLTFNLDNEALYEICTKRMGIPAPTYKDLNDLIAQTMSGISTTLRFPGQLNSDFRKMGVNLVPFPRLHFFTVGYAPLTKPGSQAFQKIGVPELTAEIFNPSSFLAACNPTLGKYLTTAIYYRGRDLSSRDVEEAVFAIRTKNSSYFADWIPNSSTMSLCSIPPPSSSYSATFVANNTAVRELFIRTQTQFSAMLRRKAFLHWYTHEGMDELEFTEAESNLQDLIAEYQQYESAEADEDDGEEAGMEPGQE